MSNPGVEKGYALDFQTVVRFVATELDGAPSGALSIEDMAKTYRHPTPADLTRVRQHHKIGSDFEAIRFLIERAVGALTHRGKTDKSKIQISSNGGGKFHLVVPFDELEHDGRRIHRLTATDDDDEQRALRATYNDLTKDREFYVTVEGAKGGHREAKYKLHPLARAIPRIPEKEFLELAADIKRNGVELPIVVYDGQVLDGRHRLAIASALEVPVKVQEVGGDEARAKARVLSLNVNRRHLSIAQRALIVQELFLPEAEAKAKERQQQSPGRGQEKVAPTGTTFSDDENVSRKAIEDAARESQGLASVRTLQRMAPVRNAPRTQERIRSGEITSGQEARREGLKETGSDEPDEAPALQPQSAWDHLGRALNSVQSAHKAITNGDVARKRGVASNDILHRIAAIRESLDLTERLIEARVNNQHK